MYHTEPPTDKTIREWYMNSSRVADCALRNEQAVRAHRSGLVNNPVFHHNFHKSSIHVSLLRKKQTVFYLAVGLIILTYQKLIEDNQFAAKCNPVFILLYHFLLHRIMLKSQHSYFEVRRDQFNPSKYEAQTAVFKDPVRTAL